ncbi:MAG: hypothetical protein JXR95_13455 [Deltaproteobacteria bacterium]|nr:hypothetical protein [Deltaproteobacteria bacterium]
MAKQDPNAWMLTFSDLLNLLITFFVMLIAMSSMDNKKLKDFAGFFSGAIGVLEKNATGSSSPGPDKSTSTRDLSGNKASASSFQLSGSLGGSTRKASSADEKGNSTSAKSQHLSVEGKQTKVVAGQEYGWQEFSRKMEKTIHDEQMRHFLSIGTKPDGYTITLRKLNPFAEGKSVILEKSLPVLEKIASLARICNCNVHIKGGFKNSENFMNGQYYSLYHLGSARAVAVTIFFQQQGCAGARLYPQMRPEGNLSQLEFFFETSRR